MDVRPPPLAGPAARAPAAPGRANPPGGPPADPKGRGAWFVIERPASRWTSAAAHGPWALLSGLAILVAYVFNPYGFPLSLCSFLSLTGYPCPFCGSTRAFHRMAHARWGDALQENPFAAVLFVAVAAVFAANAGALVAGVRLRIGPRLRPGRWGALWIAAAGAAFLIASWVYRIAAGLK